MEFTNFNIFRLNINIFPLCSLSKFSKRNNSLIKSDYIPLFAANKKFVKFEMQKCQHDDNEIVQVFLRKAFFEFPALFYTYINMNIYAINKKYNF